MATKVNPLVTVGLPVYNGDKYLEQSIQSILNQSFKDFELVVIDNCSTDETDKICQTFVEKDPRIRYSRNECNIGASANHNRTLELAQGKYFVWASYDDIRHPDYLLRCIEELENDKSASVCHCRTRYIDSDGNETPRKETNLNLDVSDPIERFGEMIRMDHKVEMILGVMRAELIKKTNGLAPFSDSDRVLMAEMALFGKFMVLPDYLFYRREHAENSATVYKSRQSRMAWFDPKLDGKISFPHFRQFREYWGVISRSPLAATQRNRARAVMMAWLWENKDRLWKDVTFVSKQLVIKTMTLMNLRSAAK